MLSKRQLQMGENIKRVMSIIFIENDLSVIAGNFVTITQAEISADGSVVKIFVDITSATSSKNGIQSDQNPSNISKEPSPLNQTNQQKKPLKPEDQIISYLKKNSPDLRFKLATKAKLRIVPEIKFLLDNTNQHILRMNELFKNPKIS